MDERSARVPSNSGSWVINILWRLNLTSTIMYIFILNLCYYLQVADFYFIEGREVVSKSPPASHPWCPAVSQTVEWRPSRGVRCSPPPQSADARHDNRLQTALSWAVWERWPSFGGDGFWSPWWAFGSIHKILHGYASVRRSSLQTSTETASDECRASSGRLRSHPRVSCK